MSLRDVPTDDLVEETERRLGALLSLEKEAEGLLPKELDLVRRTIRGLQLGNITSADVMAAVNGATAFADEHGQHRLGEAMERLLDVYESERLA